jgi:transposase InsO family protein
LCSRFVWSGINRDVNAWTKDWAKCQQSRIHRHVHVKPLTIPVPQRRFAHIHIDLVGPLTISLGHSHILTIIDRMSRWIEAIPLTNTAATSVAAALFSGWIFRFGVPDTITSDRGPQFTSNIWNSLCLLLQIKHRPTTAYHPQANGMVEQLHCRLKDVLRTRSANATWAAELPWVLLGLSLSRERTPTSHLLRLYMAHH